MPRSTSIIAVTFPNTVLPAQLGRCLGGEIYDEFEGKCALVDLGSELNSGGTVAQNE